MYTFGVDRVSDGATFGERCFLYVLGVSTLLQLKHDRRVHDFAIKT